MEHTFDYGHAIAHVRCVRQAVVDGFDSFELVESEETANLFARLEEIFGNVAHRQREVEGDVRRPQFHVRQRSTVDCVCGWRTEAFNKTRAEQAMREHQCEERAS